jgi:hypothetical protein
MIWLRLQIFEKDSADKTGSGCYDYSFGFDEQNLTCPSFNCLAVCAAIWGMPLPFPLPIGVSDSRPNRNTGSATPIKDETGLNWASQFNCKQPNHNVITNVAVGGSVSRDRKP